MTGGTERSDQYVVATGERLPPDWARHPSGDYLAALNPGFAGSAEDKVVLRRIRQEALR